MPYFLVLITSRIFLCGTVLLPYIHQDYKAFRLIESINDFEASLGAKRPSFQCLEVETYCLFGTCLLVGTEEYNLVSQKGTKKRGKIS